MISRNGKDFSTPSDTPEEIVALIGNIANRSDVREVQERQIKEIREYAAGEIFKLADHFNDMIDGSDVRDEIVNHVLWSVYEKLRDRANELLR